MIFDTTFDANPCYNHQGKKKGEKKMLQKIFWWEQIILFANEFFVFSQFYTRCLHLLLSLKSYY